MIKNLYRVTKETFEGNINYLVKFFLLIIIVGCFNAIMDPIITKTLLDLQPEDLRDVFVYGGVAITFLCICMYFTYLQYVYCDIWFYKLVGSGIMNTIKKFHKLPYLEREKNYDEGDMFNRMNNGVESTSYAWLFIALVAFNVISITVLFVYSWIVSPYIIVASVILFTFVTVRTKYEYNKNVKYAEKEQTINSKIESEIYDIIHNIEINKIDNNEDYVVNKYRDNRAEVLSLNTNKNNLRIALDAIESLFKEFLNSGLAILISTVVVTGVLTNGQVAVAFNLFTAIFANLCNVRRMLSMIAPNYVNMERLDELTSVESNNKYDYNLTDDNECCDIVFESVDVDIENSNILNNINLKIRKNEKIAIVGSNGSGKTSIIKTMLGLYTPTNGKYKNAFKDNENIAYIPSNNQLYDDSLLWNIKLSKANDVELQAIEIAKQLDLYTYEEDILDKNSNDISQGQAQRVNIIRGSIKSNNLIIADEPTSFLDEITANKVIDMLTNCDSTVVVVTHNLNQLKYFDRVVVVDNGGIVFDGDYSKWFQTLM